MDPWTVHLNVCLRRRAPPAEAAVQRLGSLRCQTLSIAQRAGIVAPPAWLSLTEASAAGLAGVDCSRCWSGLSARL